MPRARIEIDWVQFDKLCALHCTEAEIASFFDCSPDTIDRAVKREKQTGFAEYSRQKRQVGKISLRRKMFQVAEDTGNVTMLIWLSKNWLGYTDKVEQVTDSKDPGEEYTDEELDDL